MYDNDTLRNNKLTNTTSKLVCIKCDRNTWSVSRDRRVIEFRTIDTKLSSTQRYEYTSNWRKEKDTQLKKQFIRCQSCSYELELSDYPTIDEIKIDTKGILVVRKHKHW